MNEHDQLVGGTGRRARYRHLVMGCEAFLVAVALLLTLGLFDVGPEPIRVEIPAAAPQGAPAAHPDAPVPDPPLRRPRVMVIGDSLIVQSAQEQHDALVALGYDVIVAGQSGRPLDDPWIQQQVTRAAADPTIDVVVLATAANDNYGNAADAVVHGDAHALRAYRSLLERTLVRLGQRCVVLVDTRDRVDDWFKPEYAPKTNAVLTAVAAARPDTELVAWSDRSRPHTADWFADDMLHFRPAPDGHVSAGATAYAHAVAQGVDRCGAGR